jgi:2-phosphosulfolactate phosphatase
MHPTSDLTIDTYFTFAEFGQFNKTYDAIAVIDILRATTTIATTLNHGRSAVYPVSTIEEASTLKDRLNEDTLLAGERKGVRIDGFDLGNSPLEHKDYKGREKAVVMTTSNGTKAIAKTRNHGQVYLLSFANFSVTLAAFKNARNIAVVCAGSHGEFCLEDTICAGLFVQKLKSSVPQYSLNDASIYASQHSRNLWSEFFPDSAALYTVISTSRHARHLQSLGFDSDIQYAAMLDANPVAIKLQDSKLVSLTADKVAKDQN